MPRHCSATGCRSRDNKDARSAGVTFHRLPKKGNPRRATWIANARRKGPGGKGLWEPQSNYIYFCSKHFTPDSFEVSGVSGYRRLKDDAIPMLVEILPGQKGKSTRGRGKTRNRGRKLSAMSRADKGSSGSPETPVKTSLAHAVHNEEAENIKISKEEQQKETSPPLSLLGPAPDQLTELPAAPPSPSRYMRRLPPPPGFYLTKEHSYAQLCPLEWRKRYEKATDNLEKALRLLRAARRRENRLRLTLLRLQESRLKQTLSQMQDRRKESHESQGRSNRLSGKSEKTGQNRSLGVLEENEMEGTGEEMELLTDESWRKKEAAKLRDGVEDEEGCCFYCGCGREDEDIKESKVRVGSRRGATFQSKRGRGRNASDVFKETMRNLAVLKSQSTPPVHQNSNPEQHTVLCSQPEMLLHMHTLPGSAQSTLTLQDVPSTSQLQHLHLLQPEMGLQQDASTQDISVTQSEDRGGGMCQVFLVPVPSETKQKSEIGVGVGVESCVLKTLSGDTFQHVITEHVSQDAGLSSRELRDQQNDQQTNIRATLVSGDLTQRLKEHLEGFQLQLSSEFID